MRKILLMGAGLAMLAAGGVAIAQTPPPPPPGGQPPAAPNGPAPGNALPDMHGAMEMEHGSMGRFGPPGPPGPMMMHMMHRSQAAHFRFYNGDRGMDIKCADNETTQACVAAAGTLIDKLGTLRQ